MLRDVQLASRSPALFTWERLAAIWRLNSGHYASLDLSRYQNPMADIPMISEANCQRALADGLDWQAAALHHRRHVYHCIPIPLAMLELPPKADGHPWSAKDVPLRFYGRARIVADPPRPATALQLSLSHREDYEIRVNGNLVASIARIGPDGRLQNHTLSLPRPMTVKEVEIRALGRHRARVSSIGHLLIQ